jgi:hypothetical protein
MRYNTPGGHDHDDAMLFEEENGRWLTLPNKMPMARDGHALITIPTAS